MQARTFRFAVPLLLAMAATAGAQPASFTDLGALAPAATVALPIEGFVAGAAGSVRWFRFDVPAIAAPNFLDIRTIGAVSLDTEIGLFSAAGAVVASNDDGGAGNPQRFSALSFGASCTPRAQPSPLGNGDFLAGQSGATLPAGTYYLAVTRFNADFTGGFTVTGQPTGASAVAFTLDISLGAAPALTLPTPTADLGTLVLDTPAAASVELEAGAVRWVRFTAPAIAAPGTYLDIQTTGPASLNTLVALYDAAGAVISRDNDDGPGTGGDFSALSYGGTCGTRPNAAEGLASGLAFDGRDGATLAAGDYYLAITGVPPAAPDLTDLLGACFASAVGNHAVAGTVDVRVTAGTTPALPLPAATDLGALALGGGATTPFTLAPNGVLWFSVTLPAIDRAAGAFLDIATDATGDLNTILGVYNSSGARVATDTDDGPAAHSALSFGAVCATRPNTSALGALAAGVAHNGRDAAVLPAGTYYIAVSGGSSTAGFAAACFNASVNHTVAGEGVLRLTTGTSLLTPTFDVDVPAFAGDASANFTETFALTPGTFRVYRIVLTDGVDRALGRFLDVNVESGTNTDTFIGLYGVTGVLEDSDDDEGPGLGSSLSYGDNCINRPNISTLGQLAGAVSNGRDGAVLPPGVYYLVVSGLSTTLNPCVAVTTAHARSGDIQVSINYGRNAPVVAPAGDLGTLTIGSPAQTTVNLAGGDVQFFSVTLPAIDRAAGSFLDIGLSGDVTLDTQVALYRADGTRVAVDDDDGPGSAFAARFSSLTFGRQCTSRPNASSIGEEPGLFFDGRDGATLAAGQYFIGVTGGDGGASFSTVCPAGSTGGTHTAFGAVTLRVVAGTADAPTLPAATALGTLVDGMPIVRTLTLGPAEVRWFSFTVASTVAAPTYLDITTAGETAADLAIVLFDTSDFTQEDGDNDDGPGTYSALSYGAACPPRAQGVGSPLGAGVRLAGQDGTLAAGTYYLAVTGLNFFTSTACIVGVSTAIDTTPEFTLKFDLATPGPATAPVARNLGTIGTANQGLLVDDAPMASGEILWFTFVVPEAVVNADINDHHLDINLDGSFLTPGTNDTEMALYTEAGALVDADDDDGPDLLSQLSWGDTAARPVIGNGGARTGGDGALAAGTYFLAVTDFDSAFPAGCPFGITGGAGRTGTVDITFFTSVPGGSGPNQGCNVADIVSIGGFPPADNELTVDDYTSFINAFAGDELLADIVSIGGFPPSDGELTVDDYTSFINAFAEGCPG